MSVFHRMISVTSLVSCNILIGAKRNTGKTVLLRYLIFMLKQQGLYSRLLVFSHSPEEYETYIPY